MRVGATLVLGVWLVAVGIASAQGRAACDRACLEGIAEQYLEALVAKDPKRLPLAAGVKYTENGQRLQLGDGFWNSVTARGTYKLHVADQTAGQIVTFSTMREAGTPMIIALRLKVDNRRISEIETLLAHSENGAKGVEALGQPRAAFTRPTPPADRTSRADLVRVANMYFSGMQLNDGKGQYPFADDCDRIENGGKSTNAPGRGGAPRPDPKTATNYSGMWTCREQFESGLLHFVSRIRDRRYLAVDEERGLVVAFVFFDHDAGASRTFKTPDGRTVTAGPTVPWTWHIAELFKVEKGLLHEIEAILEREPYGMNSGWSRWEDGMSDTIQFAR
ncbi:MAG TPA: hypothetical protein VI485_02345 [Vicinamibacterales bacterium]|nr:hypothetical protein [Vicinamibacterales bacterium]